jgi:CubicO group peptidase (beta-lactamase class C family)
MTGLLSLALAPLCLTPAAAPPPAPLTPRTAGREIDRLVAPVLKGKKGVGIVVGLLTRDGRQVYGRGEVAVRGGKPPDGDTLFEIGSVTKVFTGVLLADLVRQRRLKLEDPAQDHLPPMLVLPRRGGRAITVLDLATHHSGLPVQPAFLLHFLFKGDPKNPYNRYEMNDLVRFLKGCKPPHEPGKRYLYSNLGYGLLGIALAHRAGTASYEDLVVRRVCDPLGMRDTRVHLTPQQRFRFAQGHDEHGKPTSTWDFATLEACGGLRSSANDLLKFATAHLGLTRTTLRPVLDEAYKPRRDVGRPNERIGLGWHVRTEPGGRQLVWHTGGTGGFSSFVGFDKAAGTVVVVLCNLGRPEEIDHIGITLLMRLRQGG